MVKKTMENKAQSERRDEMKFKGVRKRKWGKWVSEIRLPNSRERIWLGSYDSAEKAARAFDAALFCLRGHGAKFNFPDSPPEIAGGRSLSPAQIQVAAAKFANSGSDSSSGQSAGSDREMDSPSPCVSEETVQTEKTDSSDLSLDMDGSFTDLLAGTGSGNFGLDFGMLLSFDDFPSDYFGTNNEGNDFGEETFDEFLGQGSFLWNF